MSASVEILRRAAKVLREHAEAATDGPWVYLGKNIIDTPTIDVDEADWGGQDLNGYRLVACGDPGAWRYADTRYIALVDPTVGLALADWLEHEASLTEHRPLTIGDPPSHRLARAVLREDERRD